MTNAKLTVAVLCAIIAAPAVASDLYAYPSAGQSREQQAKDDYECDRWARERTGYGHHQPSQTDTGGATGRGILGGALLGAAIGEIADDKGGEGAAVGALLGGVSGHSSGRQRQQAAAASERDALNRAYKACMEGRGYDVN